MSASPQAPPPGTVSGTGTANFVPLWTDSADIGNSIVFQSGTGSTAKIGVNTTTPAATLDVKGAGTIRGVFTLPNVSVATATKGANSQPMAMTASVFNSGTNAAANQNFRWQAEPAGNNTASPSATLNLLFGAGSSTPAETGLKISSAGLFTFATGQTFPGTGTISGITAGTGLTGGGTTGSVTLNLDTTKVPELNVANTFVGNQTVTGNVSATGVVTGSSYQIGSVLFAYGSFANSNAFLGFSGNTATTGQLNTANGALALLSNTTGGGNTASGYQALVANTTGGENTASGEFALEGNTTGFSNSATGGQALQSNTTGSGNTADGTLALNANTLGSFNTATGDAALVANTTGSNNTALGYNAGPDSGHPNLTNTTAIGANAVVSANNALVLGGTGANAVNVGIGTATPAATLDVHGTGNFTGPITFAAGQTFPGAGTITGITPGTALTGGGTSGSVTLSVDTTKVVTGITAGADLTGGGTGGVQTLSLDTTKVPLLNAPNTFTGNQSVTGDVTATGTVSGGAVNATTSFNFEGVAFAFGSFSTFNTFLGFAGNQTTTGDYNTASGMSAMAFNTIGNNNTAIGTYALEANTTGNANTASGTWALTSTTTGGANTAGGMNALSNNTTGSYNTALGFYAGPDSGHPDLTNSTAIGNRASVTASNSMVLGSINGVNSATADTNVGIGTTAPTYRLHLGVSNNSFRVEGPATAGTNSPAGSFGGFGDFGIDAPGISQGRFVVKESGFVGVGVAAPSHIFQVGQGKGAAFADSWTTYSSRRWKTNIQTLPNALAKVEQLRGVSYDLKGSGKHEIGVIAEEVGQVVPEVVSFEGNGKDAQGVDYSRLTAVLIEAVKAQQRQIQEQRQQIGMQQRQIARLNSKVGVLETALHSPKRTKAGVVGPSSVLHQTTETGNKVLAAK